MRHRQRQFASGNTAADHGNGGGGGAALGCGNKIAPALRIDIQRFGPDGVVGKARNRHFRRDADIDRRDIIGNRALPFDRDQAGGPVDICGMGKDQPRTGETAQAHQINLQRVAAVMARDMSGQHAGIRRGRAGVDDRQPRTRQRVHSPFAQDQGMRVPAPNQHKVLGHGNIRRIHWRAFWNRGIGVIPR